MPLRYRTFGFESPDTTPKYPQIDWGYFDGALNALSFEHLLGWLGQFRKPFTVDKPSKEAIPLAIGISSIITLYYLISP